MILSADRIFGTIVPGASDGLLPERCKALVRQQRETWPTCRDGYASLSRVQTRSLGLQGFSLHLQFNPGRLASTGAKVDAATIRERRCFLCADNLPPEQDALLYGEDLLILCNPAPIFPEHFTIAHRDHRPQELRQYIGIMIRLSEDLSPEYCTFYNGPRCGASAPDHLHFQAAPKDTIPVVGESISAVRAIVRNMDGVEISTLPDYGRTVAVFRSEYASALAGVFDRFLAAWKRLESSDEEPMMNVLCAHEGRESRLIVFLRQRHRPEAYFLEGEAQVLVSPAAVDIGGLVITPRKKEFNGLTTDSVAAIFREVSAPPSLIQRICGSMS